MSLTAAIAVGSALYGLKQQRDSQNEQRKARRAHKRIANIQAAKQRSEAVREAIAKRGSIENLSAASGGGGSRTSGALSSLSSQLGSNLGFSQQTQFLSGKASDALQRSSDLQTRASIFQSIGNQAFALTPESVFDFGN